MYKSKINMINSILHSIGSGVLSVLIAIHIVAPVPTIRPVVTNNENSISTFSLSRIATTTATTTGAKTNKKTGPDSIAKPIINKLSPKTVITRQNTNPQSSVPVAGIESSKLPPATPTQIAGVMRLCALDTKQDCGAILNAYNSSVTARSSIDSLIQRNDAPVPKQSLGQTVAQCEQTMTSSESSLMNGLSGAQLLSAEAGIQAACGDTNASFTQSQAQSAQTSALNSQLQQIKLQQAIQQSLNTSAYTPQPTPKPLQCTTKPYWDSGVIRFTTNCN